MTQTVPTSSQTALPSAIPHPAAPPTLIGAAAPPTQARGLAAKPLDDAYAIATRVGLLTTQPLGSPSAQRKLLLDAIAAAVNDPERLIDAGAFASIQLLVHESVIRERDQQAVKSSPSAAATARLSATRSRGTVPARADWAGDYEGSFLNDPVARDAFVGELERMTGVRAELPRDLAERIAAGGGNVPCRELEEVTLAVIERLRSDPAVLARLESDPALRALHVQTINHLQHATFAFERDGDDYPHADVLKSPCPFRPTLKALLKAMDFERFVFGAPATPVVDQEPNEAVEKAFKDAEQDVVNAMIADPHGRYCDMRDRLAAEGPNAKLVEHAGTVGYLIEKLKSDADLKQIAGGSQLVASFRAAALAELERVQAAGLPHRRTVDAIERAIECFDVVARAMHPDLSPALYHSGRYEYYVHYLSEESPEHINLPTIAALGSTDLLKARGVPLGFWGVNTQIERVDGFYQTPYEFMMHDVNHDRRMYQFAREQAERLGIPVAEYYASCAKFVQETLLPLFVPVKGDSDDVRKHKRLVKMVLFEVLHEDALPADASVIVKAMLRPPKARTPFERIEDDARVVYYTEEGATTLAYVFRKLAHTFYDVPEDRKAYIVTDDLRTREAIVSAARTVFDALGATAPEDLLRRYVATDEGLPDAFRHELDEDIYRRAGAFARGVISGTSDEEKLAAAESLATLALETGPYLLDSERARLAALQRDAEGRLTAPLRAVLRARLHAIATGGAVEPRAVHSTSFVERLDERGLKTSGVATTIGKARVQVLFNDIAIMPVDAVLVPQLQGRASVGGVGDDVWKRGGDKGLRAFDALAKEKGPLPHGFVHLAESGSKHWPYLLNTVTVRAAPDTQFETAFNSVVNALTVAGKAGLSSVAVPALCTGIDGRLSFRQSARAILGALDYLATAGVEVPDVLITVQEEGYQAFAQVLREESYRLEGGRAKAERGEREFDVRRWAAGIARQMANQEDFEASAPV